MHQSRPSTVLLSTRTKEDSRWSTDSMFAHLHSNPSDKKKTRLVAVSRFWDEAFVELATDCVYVICSIGTCLSTACLMIVCFESLNIIYIRLQGLVWPHRGSNDAKWNVGLVTVYSPLICAGSEYIWECLCLGESVVAVCLPCVDVSSLSCAGGDRGKNVVCVTCCAEARGLPVRPIKNGWFPADDVNCQRLLV